MPLGVPGYKPLEGVIFKTWCRTSPGAPRMVAATGTFRVHERALHSAFQIEAPEIKPGFSGSPVWDSARKTGRRICALRRVKAFARCRPLHRRSGNSRVLRRSPCLGYRFRPSRKRQSDSSQDSWAADMSKLGRQALSLWSLEQGPCKVTVTWPSWRERCASV